MKNLLIAALFVPSLSFAAVQKLSASGGQVDFLAKGRPNLFRVTGKGSAPTGQLTVDGEKISGTLEFQLTTLETGLETRDHHMKDKYLEVEKYPKATLEIKSVGHLASWTIKNPMVS